jgi:hypothetical protein
MDVEGNRGSFQEHLLETYQLVRMNLDTSHTGTVRFVTGRIEAVASGE